MNRFKSKFSSPIIYKRKEIQDNVICGTKAQNMKYNYTRSKWHEHRYRRYNKDGSSRITKLKLCIS